ncbi:MAG: hypothetical protein HC916_10945 [Coleofasciculaceae cyanobacterium SM2_1_6]|nr:hypothetical protein [Coleofasciculaceae cyanobacterium SM2_1_6]
MLNLTVIQRSKLRQLYPTFFVGYEIIPHNLNLLLPATNLAKSEPA